jgi:pimeloyl-ACP methyl ester carboxylesterase
VSEPHSPPLRGTLLFVHGLWTTGAESLLLRHRLAQHGWALRVFPYSSIAEPMDRVARRCARAAQSLASRTLLPVHLLGHSLGGLVVYRMFETGLLAPDRFSGDFCRAILMGTPARGSRTARALASTAIGRRMLGSTGASDLIDGIPARWPFPVQLGVIAGNVPHGLGRLITRFDEPCDGTVAVSETLFEGAADHRVLPVSHFSMAFSTEVTQLVAAFLDHGHFGVHIAGSPERSR